MKCSHCEPYYIHVLLKFVVIKSQNQLSKVHVRILYYMQYVYIVSASTNTAYSKPRGGNSDLTGNLFLAFMTEMLGMTTGQ